MPDGWRPNRLNRRATPRCPGWSPATSATPARSGSVLSCAFRLLRSFLASLSGAVAIGGIGRGLRHYENFVAFCGIGRICSVCSSACTFAIPPNEDTPDRGRGKFDWWSIISSRSPTAADHAALQPSFTALGCRFAGSPDRRSTAPRRSQSARALLIGGVS